MARFSSSVVVMSDTEVVVVEGNSDEEEQEDSILRNETTRFREGHWISDCEFFVLTLYT